MRNTAFVILVETEKYGWRFLSHIGPTYKIESSWSLGGAKLFGLRKEAELICHTLPLKSKYIKNCKLMFLALHEIKDIHDIKYPLETHRNLETQ